jgi:hypothetical protein
MECACGGTAEGGWQGEQTRQKLRETGGSERADLA